MLESCRGESPEASESIVESMLPVSLVRRGKWTIEELDLVEALVHFCSIGLLPEARGHTLRVYLSGLLACEPMRITKRFSGFESVGKVRDQRA